MRGLKRDLWKAGIAIAGMLLFLVLMAWIPVSAASAEVRASGFVGPGTGTVQASPSVDATVTALSKEQLTLQIKQLQNQLQNQNNWLANNSTALIAAVTALVVALFGIVQWTGNRRDARQKEIAAQDKELEDRKAERERRDEEQQRWLKDQEAEREKRAEERFQAVVEGLGSTTEARQIGAAITLRTFLQKGYEQFYSQAFDLAVAHLRLRPIDADKAEPLDSLSQALITIFKESFPLVRNQHTQDIAQQLDAARIQLDKAFLAFADLKQAWMPFAYLREANLHKATLNKANLHKANLSEANLYKADLSETTLYRASLYKASLRRANLSGTDLSGSNLSNADLSGANLTGAKLHRADLSRVNIEDALSLENTDLRGVKGQSNEQLAACKAKGAIIDKDLTASSPQPTVAPPQSLQSNGAQVQPAPAVQGSTPTPDAGESSAPSSKSGPES